MTFQFDGYNWLVRLEKGEPLVENLTKLVKQEAIKGAWISGIGGALSATLGFYDLEKQQYNWKTFDELMEITSLQGNIAWNNGQPVLHIHGTLTGSNMQAIGGHVKELTVGGTGEVLLHRWYKDALTRSHDDQVGLALLDV